jgi:hypothetical protein
MKRRFYADSDGKRIDIGDTVVGENTAEMNFDFLGGHSGEVIGFKKPEEEGAAERPILVLFKNQGSDPLEVSPEEIKVTIKKKIRK